MFVLAASSVARHAHGPPIDYVGLAAAAAASWVGLPGPGEPVLIAAGVLAARHRLSLSDVLLVAWVAATLGGIGGWLIGLIAGRSLMTAPGPLRRMRLAAMRRGDEVFARYPVVAVLLTPSWVAGIHRVGTGLYMLINVLGAAAWAVGIGLGAYFAGPAVLDSVNDFGLATTLLLGALIVAVVVAELVRRRRRAGPTDPSGPRKSTGKEPPANPG